MSLALEVFILATVRLLSLACSLALTALVLDAVRAGSFLQSGSAMLADPWGVVALADLYLGFVIIALLIALVERNWLRAVFWITPIFFLGNIWTGVWLVFRAGTLLSWFGMRPQRVSSQNQDKSAENLTSVNYKTSPNPAE